MSYQEALTVLQLKELYPKELAHCRHYRELGYYRALPLLHKDRGEARYENKSLERLAQYDRKHNSNLLHTLEIYLNHNCNMQAAADALHIHVNTLSYRLKRIAEFGEMDLDNMDVKMTCYMDLKMSVLKDRERLNR